MKLITSDLSQIEPRVLAWLAGDADFLTMVASGKSPYEAHARLTMGWTGGVLKNENEKLYGLAKIRVLQLGYGSGWEKFIQTAKKEAGIDLTAEDPEWIETPDPVTGEPKKVSGYGHNARAIVKAYRDSNPKITDLWKQLESALRRSIGQDLVLRLPSGRELRYESIRAETRIGPNKETKKPERKTVYTAVIGGKRTITYGAKLCANITSATARDVFYEHVLKLHDAGFVMLIGVYDECVLEVPLDRVNAVSEVKTIMSQTPAWLPGCPVAADAKEVERYCK